MPDVYDETALDLNDEAEVLWELFASGEINNIACQRGVPLVVGFGTSPGLTNIWARIWAIRLPPNAN